MNFPSVKIREILCWTLVHGIETLAVASSPLGDSSQATSPFSRTGNRERQGSLAQLEVIVMRIMQHLWSSLLRSERKEIIPSGLRLGAPACVLAAAILMLLLAAAGTAFGGSATWLGGKGGCQSCWRPDRENNWTPATVPNGPADIATFDVSNLPFPWVDETDIEVNGIVFNAGASAFTIDVYSTSSFGLALTISGVGITKNSFIKINFTIGMFY